MLVFPFLLFVLFFSSVVVRAEPSRDFDDDEMDFFRADSGTTRAPRCVSTRPCVTNGDCAGEGHGFQAGKPWCSGGAQLGKCDCTACVGGVPCKDDSKCGGLDRACSSKTKTCNCLEAAQSHYDDSDAEEKAKLPTLGSAIASFCVNESCLNSTVNCYGLPCKKGICICP